MTLRGRITLMTALLLLVSSALLGLVAYQTTERVQLEAIDRALANTATNPRLRALLTKPTQTASLDPGTIALGLRPADASGITTLRPAGSLDDPIAIPNLSEAQIQAALLAPITVVGTPDFRVVARGPRARGTVVIAAATLTELQSSLGAFALGMSAAVLGITAGGAFVAWFAVRRFFRPMEEMVRAAEALAAGNMERRVPQAPIGTELGKLAQALNAMIGSLTASILRAESSESQLRRVVSDASHEIRTPLTVIRGYVDLLARESAGEDQLSSRALARLGSETERLQRLVDSLLVLERSAIRTEPRPVDWSAIVADALADLRVMQPERQVSQDLAPAVVLGDEDGLRQLVGNLVQNIERHTPGDAPVHALLTVSDQSARLVLQDAGPGIDPHDRERAMERFARLTSGPPGSGLGLAIVDSVVRAHGGSIALRASPLGGLEVEVDLPISPAPA